VNSIVNVLEEYPNNEILNKVLKLVIKSFWEENKEEFLH
jgi:hypothetical protein